MCIFLIRKKKKTAGISQKMPSPLRVTAAAAGACDLSPTCLNASGLVLLYPLLFTLSQTKGSSKAALSGLVLLCQTLLVLCRLKYCKICCPVWSPGSWGGHRLDRTGWKMDIPRSLHRLDLGFERGMQQENMSDLFCRGGSG